MILFMLLSPILGVTMGIAALCMGRKRIGVVGFIIALITVVVPILAVIAFVIAVETGAIVFGM